MSASSISIYVDRGISADLAGSDKTEQVRHRSFGERPMLQDEIDRLKKLDREIRLVRGGNSSPAGRLGARYTGTPSFQNLSVAGTRPASDRGVTFHFKHTFISKGNSVSSGIRDQTSAPSHQSYMERRGAAESIADASTGQDRLVSFGNIGDNKNVRSDFWRKVERSEGRRARVQSRLIVELPHEISPAAREQIAREFCKELSDRSFPFWCVIHAPGPNNDERNFHMHIAYYDRPSRLMSDGRWDFEIVEERRYANRSRRLVRPFRQNKDRDAQGSKWIRHLRATYAEVANNELERHASEKRYDPRPYRESGISKQPTVHLGNKAFAAETKGLDTRVGLENVRRETEYRARIGIDPLEHRVRVADDLLQALSNLDPDSIPHRRARDAAVSAVRSILSSASDASSRLRQRNTHDLAADAVSRRLLVRSSFLSRQSDKLIKRPPKGRDVEAMDVAYSMVEEKIMVDDAISEAEPFVNRCRAVARSREKEITETLIDQDKNFAILKQFHAQISRDDFSENMFRKRAALPAIENFITAFETTGYAIGDALHPISGARVLDIRTPPTMHDEMGTGERHPGLEDIPALPIEPKRKPGGAGTGGSGGIEIHLPDPIDADESSRPVVGKDDGKTDRDGADLANKIPAPPTEDERRKDLGDLAAEAMRGGRKASRSDRPIFPDAFIVDPDRGRDGEHDLDSQLVEFTNAELRYHAFATRDASMMTENREQARSFQIAWDVAARHAAKRGLDLETGIHNPNLATDFRLSKKHVDSAQMTRPRPGYQRQR